MSSNPDELNPERVVFTFDRTIADLVPKFLARCRERLASIERNSDRDDMQAIETIGLELAGAGQPFGFPQISAVGREIVVGAQREDHAAIHAGVARLRRHLEALAVIHPDAPTP